MAGDISFLMDRERRERATIRADLWSVHFYRRLAQATEKIAQCHYLIFSQRLSERLVEDFCFGLKGPKTSLPRFCDSHEVYPSVIRRTRAAYQPLGLHGVEVVSQRRTLDARKCGQISLRVRSIGMQGEQDEPRRERAAFVAEQERFKCPARHFRRLKQHKSDGCMFIRHPGSIA